MKMYCITIYNDHYDKIKKLDYIPVGLGQNIVSPKFISDDKGINISKKNPYYGEYSFHYWLWKNEINNLDDHKWIGFCQYRKYWTTILDNNGIKNIEELKENILKKIPNSFDEYETILGEPLYINQFKFSKLLKKGFLKIISKPNLLFAKDKRNIKFHFDVMHGEGNLKKAIALLENNDREDFSHFVNTEVSFNPHNMFICKSNKTLKKYYDAIFPWLQRCEKEFGFELEGYGLKRIYGFLAERFMSYWFRKYTKHSTLPIIFKDISNLN